MVVKPVPLCIPAERYKDRYWYKPIYMAKDRGN
jgi:hypothetical protein